MTACGNLGHVAGVENVVTEVESVQGPQENRLPKSQVDQVEPRKLWGKPFTKENAREMSARAVQRKKDLEEQARKTAELGAQNEAEYRQGQLTRVRAHIERLHRKIELCTDAKEMQALTQALKNIAELEAKLRAPNSPKSTSGSRSSTVSPVE